MFSGIADAQQDLRIGVADGQCFAQFGADGCYFAGLVERGAGNALFGQELRSGVAAGVAGRGR